MKSSHSSWTYIFTAHMKRDFLTNSRSLIDVVSIIAFMLLIIFLFPLGIGPEKEKLGIVSNAIIWIGLILAILPSLEKILQKDFESGWLDQIATTDVPLEIILLSKSISYWLIVLIPTILSSPLFAILLSMELKYLPWLILSMSIGGLGISLIGLNGSALILGAKRGNILLPILIIPLMIPILIFGVGINEAVKIGESPFGNLFLLMALTLIYLVISPFISALLVRIAIGR
jgi:heme exporter protein B